MKMLNDEASPANEVGRVSHESPSTSPQSEASFERSLQGNPEFSIGLQARAEKLHYLAENENDVQAALKLAILSSRYGTADMKAEAAPILTRFAETLPVVAAWLSDESRAVRMSAANSIRALRYAELQSEHQQALEEVDKHVIWKAYGRLKKEVAESRDAQFLEAVCMALDGESSVESLVLLRKMSEYPNPGVHFVARMFLDLRAEKGKRATAG